MKKKKLAGLRVYLCGAVEMQKIEAGEDWRTKITKICQNRFKMRVYNPLIKPNWMPDISGKDQQEMFQQYRSGGHTQKMKCLNHATRMFGLALAQNADIIILHYNHKVHTVGTFEEIRSCTHKPVFIVSEKRRISMWLIDQLDLYSNHQRAMYVHYSIDSLGATLDMINNGKLDIMFDAYKWIPITYGVRR